MPDQLAYTIFPLGDSAMTIDFGNCINESVNQKVLALFHALKENAFPGIVEFVPAYSSLTIYYDLAVVKKNNPQYKTAYEAIAATIEKKFADHLPGITALSQFIKIPVCYDPEFSLDIDELANAKNLTRDEVIQSHVSKVYTVYMLGFLPGFAYMGKVDEEISIPRKSTPRQRVEAGSIGIAGYQTGIYPLASPGGWQIIGRTPLQLFRPANDELTLLKPGDTVQFYSISKDEFNSY